MLSTCVALVVASGRGERFGGNQPKQFHPLGGQPMLRRCLERFSRHAAIDGVRTVVRPADGARSRFAAVWRASRAIRRSGS
jgi:2-C-methyl-D-erythritol 4-phosphate cytidylyltransferase/2-C-methyl-D-erythritol 2,4-cyclodiphosphate synthase